MQIADTAKEKAKSAKSHFSSHESEWMGNDLPRLLFKTIWHGIGFREDTVTNEDAGAIFERRHKIAKDLNALLVRPVVKYQTEEVGVGVLDRLRFEEIVLHEAYSTLIFLV